MLQGSGQVVPTFILMYAGSLILKAFLNCHFKISFLLPFLTGFLMVFLGASRRSGSLPREMKSEKICSRAFGT